MNEKIYLHTINNGMSDFYKSRKQLDTLDSILKSGKVLSRRLQGYPENSYTNFSGMDYISLTDYEKRFICNKERERYNSFYAYVRNGLSITFPHESLDVIEPTIIGICSKDARGYRKMYALGLCEEERYTDLPDEVQVKDRVSLDKMSGITFPVESYLDTVFFRRKKVKLELIKQEINIIKELLDKYNYNDINLYNIDDLQEINDDYLEERIMLTKTK